MKKLSREDFLARAKEIHGDKYDYSLADYVNSQIKVKIRCKACGGIFEQRPAMHLLGQGCPECYYDSVRKRSREILEKHKAEYISKAKKIHGSKYDYSPCEYAGIKSRVKIICPVHGLFTQHANEHLRGHGCPYCGRAAGSTDIFKKRAEEIYGSEYDCSEVVYKDQYTRVKLTHNLCSHSFMAVPKYFLMAQSGCPFCRNISNGERRIFNLLVDWGYVEEKDFTKHKHFKDLGTLSYDFYLPGKDLLIEYNGKQHYEPVERFGGEKQLHLQRHHDWLKRKYARDNGFKLLTIPYWEFKVIDKILEENIGS